MNQLLNQLSLRREFRAVAKSANVNAIFEDRPAAIFVDFHGTLSPSTYWSECQSEKLRDGIQQFLFGESRLILADWMRGRYTSEEVCLLISTRLEVPYQTVWNGLLDSCRNMVISSLAIARIQRLRREVPIILVTSNMDCFSRFVVPAKRLQSKFDQIVNSSEVGILKDDGEGQLFVDLCQQLGIEIEQTILLDDSKSICSIFKKLGGFPKLVEACELTKYHLSLDRQECFSWN